MSWKRFLLTGVEFRVLTCPRRWADGGQGGRRIRHPLQRHLPRVVKAPLVKKQIPEQAQQLGISEEEVVNWVMLGDTVDQEFTTMQDVAEAAVFFASFPSNALTGQSLVVSHGWFME